ncbi:MAG: Holliday junction resolvase RuvX [Chitinophagaceae bacterium]|nr:Holliday junction resolvase RuvX [Chitinophagaceae bacterium]
MRVLALDYGGKRTGIAVTDAMQIIANGLTTVDSATLIVFLKKYFAQEQVEKVIIGMPKTLQNNDTHGTNLVIAFIEKFRTEFPEIPIETVDERFTSKMAFQTMIDSGLKKMDRRNKALVDEISATIILQGYLEGKSF